MMRKVLTVLFFFLLLLPVLTDGAYSSLSAQGLPDQEIGEVVVIGEWRGDCPRCKKVMTANEYAGHKCCVLCHKDISETMYCDCTDSDLSGSGSGGGGSGGSGSGGSGSGSSGSGGNNSYSATKSQLLARALRFNEKTLNDAVMKAVNYTQKKYPGKAACNIGVQEVAKYVYGHLPPELAGMANEIYNNVQKSSNWVNLTSKEAGTYAQQGYFVIGVWKNPSGGHGHIVLVRGYSNSLNSNMVMDTGPTPQGKHSYQIFNNSFGKKKREYVKFYIYTGN